MILNLKFSRLGSIIFTSLLLASCGNISIGVGNSTNTSINDPRPSGTQINGSQFSSQNGKPVSGSALIFKGGNTFEYTLRLEGISVPSESGLQVQVYDVMGNQVQEFSLESNSGSQNYSLTHVSTQIIFKSVYIYSTLNQQNYAAAFF